MGFYISPSHVEQGNYMLDTFLIYMNIDHHEYCELSYIFHP